MSAERWSALPVAQRRFFATCFSKGMLNYAAASFGMAKLQALFPETAVEQLRTWVQDAVQDGLWLGGEDGFYFTKDGCGWAKGELRAQTQAAVPGLALPNPFGPPPAQFPWPVHNPQNRRWTIGQKFDTGVCRRDGRLRDEAIVKMADALEDPFNRGKAQHKEYHEYRCHYVLRNYRLMWIVRPDGTVAFNYFTRKEGEDYM